MDLLNRVFFLSFVVPSVTSLHCDRRQFVVNDTCCDECPPGSVVKEPCRGNKKTVCAVCDIGKTFKAHFNNDTECDEVSFCEDVIVKNATLIENLTCDCPSGQYKHEFANGCFDCEIGAPCSSCDRVNNMTRPCPKICPICKLFANDIKNNERKSSKVIVWCVTSVFVLLFIMSIVILVWWRCRNAKSRSSRYRAAFKNDADAELCTKNVSDVPYVSDITHDVIEQLGIMLNPKVRGKSNWKDLAKRMGATKDEIIGINLENSNQRTQALLFKKCNTQSKMTVSQLHNLLLRIRRKDAAFLLDPLLPVLDV